MMLSCVVGVTDDELCPELCNDDELSVVGNNDELCARGGLGLGLGDGDGLPSNIVSTLFTGAVNLAPVEQLLPLPLTYPKARSILDPNILAVCHEQPMTSKAALATMFAGNRRVLPAAAERKHS